MNVEKELKKYIVGRLLHGESNKLQDDQSLFELGLIDSFSVLQLVAFIEERFGIRIQDEELIPENFDSLNKIKEFVESKLVMAGK